MSSFKRRGDDRKREREREREMGGWEEEDRKGEWKLISKVTTILFLLLHPYMQREKEREREREREKEEKQEGKINTQKSTLEMITHLKHRWTEYRPECRSEEHTSGLQS